MQRALPQLGVHSVRSSLNLALGGHKSIEYVGDNCPFSLCTALRNTTSRFQLLPAVFALPPCYGYRWLLIGRSVTASKAKGRIEIIARHRKDQLQHQKALCYRMTIVTWFWLHVVDCEPRSSPAHQKIGQDFSDDGRRGCNLRAFMDDMRRCCAAHSL